MCCGHCEWRGNQPCRWESRVLELVGQKQSQEADLERFFDRRAMCASSKSSMITVSPRPEALVAVEEVL